MDCFRRNDTTAHSAGRACIGIGINSNHQIMGELLLFRLGKIPKLCSADHGFNAGDVNKQPILQTNGIQELPFFYPRRASHERCF